MARTVVIRDTQNPNVKRKKRRKKKKKLTWWRVLGYIIGMILFVLYDWWAAILHTICGKGHKWICRSWFSNRRRTFYCNDCGHNFSE